MAFCLFGCPSSTQTVQTNNQTTNVSVEVNPAISFGSEFLRPIADSLMAINEGIVGRLDPLAKGIQGSIDNANRLTGDLRRTANFSVTPAAQPVGSGPSPLVMIGGAALLAVLLNKLL